MKFERVRRTVVFTVVVAVLWCAVFRPRPVRAADTTVLIVGSIAIYIGAVVAGALLMRQNTPGSLGLMPMERAVADRAGAGVQPAHRCKQTSGNLTLACW